MDKASEVTKSPLMPFRDGEIFNEIASRAFRFTGLVAFQKRIWGLLHHRLQFPSAGILSAWEIVFERWLHVSRDVSASSMESADERSLTE